MTLIALSKYERGNGAKKLFYKNDFYFRKWSLFCKYFNFVGMSVCVSRATLDRTVRRISMSAQEIHVRTEDDVRTELMSE